MTFVNHDVVILEVLVGELHNLFFCDVGDTVNIADLLFPWFLGDERFDILVSAACVAFHPGVISQLIVVDD